MKSVLRPLKHHHNEQGFVLVVSLVILLILIVIGIAATNTTTFELQISGNEKVHKQTFSQADGGTELGTRLIEENVACAEGFDATGDEDGDGDQDAAIGNIIVDNLSFALPGTVISDPSDINRDIFTPAAYGTGPHTNLTFGGQTVTTPGSGLQMVSGYEGLGKGSASGGSHILYNMNSQHLGPVNSQSLIGLGWRHIVGLEGECNY